MAVTLRSGLNRQLTHAEMDENFRPLKEALNGTAAVTERGFWPDITSTTQIWRMADRVFIGEAANATGNRTGTQTAWPATSGVGPNWITRDSQFISTAATGLIAVSGLSRTSDQDITGGNPTESIGGAFYAEADRDSSFAWGTYIEVVRRNDTSQGYCIELDAKNIGADVIPQPYALGTTVHGIWAAAGGDGTYGGVPTNPSGAAIVILANDHTWNTGIVFSATGLTGTDGLTGTANAIEMAKGHTIRWRTSDGNTGFLIRSDVSNAAQRTQMVIGNQAFQLLNADSKRSFQVTAVGSGVNFLAAQGAATGVDVELQALGDDTNINLKLVPKGSGVVSFGTWTSNADAAVNGYVTIKDSSGNTRKLATIA
jgi:intracellular sulfur oxidation DsrE/DsrF family protein